MTPKLFVGKHVKGPDGRIIAVKAIKEGAGGDVTFRELNWFERLLRRLLGPKA